MNDVSPQELAKRFGYSSDLVKRYVELFGMDETLGLLAANEKGLKRCIRANTLRIQPEDLAQRLEKKGFKLERIGWVPNGFRVLEERFPLGSTPEFLMGYYYVQDAASMLAAHVLAPKPTDCVVELGSAPGGKTTQLAQIMRNQGVIVAVDLNRERMRALRSNLSRCGVANVVAYRMDGRDVPNLGLDVDKVLLDAPCSCDGVIPFDQSRKMSRTIEDIMFCSTIQKKLLVAAVECLHPGGEMVYSTCSTAPEEDEFIIADAIRQLNVEIVDTALGFGDEGFRKAFGVTLPEELRLARRFYPHKHGVEGFFLSKLKKRLQ